MPPVPSSLLNPRLSLSLKPLLLFSQSSLAPRKFPISRQLLSEKPRNFSSLASVQSSATDNGGRSSGAGGGGRSGALFPSPVAEEVQRIDVNPPKGTRDFPPFSNSKTGFLQDFGAVLLLYSVPQLFSHHPLARFASRSPIIAALVQWSDMTFSNRIQKLRRWTCPHGVQTALRVVMVAGM